jgi:hypothetical protein
MSCFVSVERMRRAADAAGCVAVLVATGLLVGVPGAAGGGGALAPAGAASPPIGPSVQTMIVGAGNRVLASARTISVTAASVQVGRRTCAVAAGTPLAALADLHRVRGPAFAIRDYGHCGASPSASGELFVYSLDGETNHGQNGWEYKVGNRSGTTGAGSTSGARGDGRLLRSGERVLWFWCQAVAGGCQRTLEVSAATAVSRGGRLSVRVLGYDNGGRGSAMSGAVVRFGRSSARTGSSGRATLTAPSAPGLYALTATRSGSVPSFPETVSVR